MSDPVKDRASLFDFVPMPAGWGVASVSFVREIDSEDPKAPRVWVAPALNLESDVYGWEWTVKVENYDSEAVRSRHGTDLGAAFDAGSDVHRELSKAWARARGER